MSNVARRSKMSTTDTTAAAPEPKLLNEVRAHIRRLNYSIHTEDTYVD